MKLSIHDFKNQLATLKDAPPEGNEWIHEIKFDGYRTLAIKIGDKVSMVTRNGNDWTATYKQLADDLKKLPFKNIVVDGEICIIDESGVTNFNKLQNSVGRNSYKKDVRGLIFYAFDLLYLDEIDYRQIPLIERKKKLKSIFKKFSKNYLYSEHFQVAAGAKVIEEFCKLKLEGVISKRKDSIYRAGRNGDWIKAKCQRSDEFVVIGYLPGKSHPFGALLLGEYQNKTLKYVGKVGTGFSNVMKKDFIKTAKVLTTLRPAIKEIPKELKEAIWIRPKIIAEVNFLERSEQGFRHSSFKTFRKDKSVKDLRGLD
jgi:bifunctional non-homologous end joining protein LigD